EMADADGERAVSREVEEEVEAEGVHVTDGRAETGVARGRRQPVLVDQRGDDELVEEALRDALDARLDVTEGAEAARRQRVELAREVVEAVDRPGADGRREEQVARDVRRARYPGHDAVAQHDDRIDHPERHVRDAEEAEGVEETGGDRRNPGQPGGRL